MTQSREKCSDDAIANALVTARGNVKRAAEALGYTRRHLYKRITQSAELKAVLEDERESLGDDAESVIANAIAEDDVKTAKWYLATMHGKRGYQPSTRIDLDASVAGKTTEQLRADLERELLEKLGLEDADECDD